MPVVLSLNMFLSGILDVSSMKLVIDNMPTGFIACLYQIGLNVKCLIEGPCVLCLCRGKAGKTYLHTWVQGSLFQLHTLTLEIVRSKAFLCDAACNMVRNNDKCWIFCFNLQLKLTCSQERNTSMRSAFYLNSVCFPSWFQPLKFVKM